MHALCHWHRLHADALHRYGYPCTRCVTGTDCTPMHCIATGTRARVVPLAPNARRCIAPLRVPVHALCHWHRMHVDALHRYGYPCKRCVTGTDCTPMHCTATGTRARVESLAPTARRCLTPLQVPCTRWVGSTYPRGTRHPPTGRPTETPPCQAEGRHDPRRRQNMRSQRCAVRGNKRLPLTCHA